MKQENIPATHEDFVKAREIPKHPDPPQLSEGQIEKITHVVFSPCDPVRSEVMFIPGSSLGDWKMVADWFLAGNAEVIIACGMLGRLYYETGRTLASCICDELVSFGVDPGKILKQERSRSTYEDWKYGKEVLEAAGNYPRSLAIACKSHHSGRCIRTMRRFFPS